MDDGLAHYHTLGLPRSACAEDVKQAYRRLARTLHPDKGGSAPAFAALQAAFEVLSDPRARAAYDALAGDARFSPGAAAAAARQQAPGAPPAPPPGVAEALLLQTLLARAGARPGAVLDPARQLCLTCEVCRRPATQACWTCGMNICEFCTRRQHWKGSMHLHWPLVDKPGHLLETLGRRELEAKRKEDADAFKQRLPGYRPQSELLVLREFQDALLDALAAAAPAAADGSNAQHGEPARRAPKAQPAGGGGSRARAHQQQQQPARSSTFALPPAGALVAGPGGGSTALAATPDKDGALSLRSASPAANRCWLAWRAAGPEARRALQGAFHSRLARHYMWAQSQASLLLAVHLPTGGGAPPPKLSIEVSTSGLLVQHQGFAPVLSRAWACPIDAAAGVTSWVSEDGELLALLVPKAAPGSSWGRAFQGDPHGARCLAAPYRLLQLPGEVQLELPLPWWVHPSEDVQVSIGNRGLRVDVDGLPTLTRTCSSSADQATAQVVVPGASSWCVLEQPPGAAGTSKPGSSRAAARRADKLLSISLVLPEPTQEEMQFKQGVRQNNAAATRGCPYGAGRKGRAFFEEDEDEFGLGPLLQALCLHEAGRTWVPPAPWEAAAGASDGRWVDSEAGLSPEAAQHLAWLSSSATAGGRVGE